MYIRDQTNYQNWCIRCKVDTSYIIINNVKKKHIKKSETLEDIKRSIKRQIKYTNFYNIGLILKKKKKIENSELIRQ